MVRLALILVGLLGLGGLVYLANDRLNGDSNAGQQQSRGPTGQPVPSAVGFFITPSGRIACRWTTASGGSGSIECGVATGLNPRIPSQGPDCRRFPYVGRIAIATSGRVRLIACAEGNGPFADPGSTVYLRYGETWKTKDLSCHEAITGLRCRNRDGHGFFLSIFRWFLF